MLRCVLKVIQPSTVVCRNVLHNMAEDTLSFDIIPGAVELLPRRQRNVAPDRRQQVFRPSMYIPSRDIRVIDGTSYTHIAKRKPFIRRLVSYKIRTNTKTAVNTILKGTTVIAQLSECKKERFRILASDGTTSQAKRFRARSKMYTKNILKMPEVIQVQAPTIGSVGGVEMSMLRVVDQAELWVEVNSANISYIANALLEQHKALSQGEPQDDDSGASVARASDIDSEDIVEDDIAPQSPLGDDLVDTAAEEEVCETPTKNVQPTVDGVLATCVPCVATPPLSTPVKGAQQKPTIFDMLRAVYA